MGGIGDLFGNLLGGVGNLVGGVAGTGTSGQWGGGIGEGIGGLLGGVLGNTGVPGNTNAGFGGLGPGSPGQQGRGIMPPQPYSPYQTSAGLQTYGGDPYGGQRFNMGAPNSGAPTQQPTAWDFASPGVAEQFWNNQQGQFLDRQKQYNQQGSGETLAQRIAPNLAGQQGAASQYWNQVQGNLAKDPSQQQMAQQAYEGFQRAKPSMAQDAGLSPYYENAKRRASEDINQAYGARGAYGSSAAGGAVSEAMTNLEAERANREADYGLNRLAEQRAWETTAGNLGLGASGMGLNWLQGLGGLAGQAGSQDLARQLGAGNLGLAGDQLGLSRMGQGNADLLNAMSAANMAQNARRMRGRDMMGDLFGMAGMTMPMTMNTYGQMIQNDMGLMGPVIDYQLGLGREAANQDYRRQQRPWTEASNTAGLLGSFFGGFF